MGSLPQEASLGNYSDLPAKLPPANVPDDIDLTSIASVCVGKLGHTLQENALTDDAIWRDNFAFTGTLRTFYGLEGVAAAWKKLADLHKPHDFKLTPNSALVLKFGDPVEHSWIQAMFTFETEGDLPQTCSGFLGITLDPQGEWKIWTIRTILEGFRGYPNVDTLEPQPSNGNAMKRHHPSNGALNGEADSTFDVAIVGGGQAGLATAGRLKALGVSNIVLEANDQLGGNWMSRYDSARLHTTKESSHLPFDRSFLEEDPELLTRENLSNAYKRYAEKYDINVSLSTFVEMMSWNSKRHEWTLQIKYHDTPKIITAKHAVLACGMNLRTPYTPDIPNRDLFKGKAMHATQYKNSSEWKGLKGIVIGTANTAHDVAQDMVEAGLSSITMIQRSPTYVFPLSHIFKTFHPLWNLSLPTPLSDRLTMTTPHAISRLLINHSMSSLAHADDPYYNLIRQQTSFKILQFADISAYLYGNPRRAGGHYIDVGNMQNIVEGKVKVKSDAAIKGFVKEGIEFEDGGKVEADVVVFATGFRNDVVEMVERMCGEEVKEKVRGEGWWGVDSEGEIRGASKPCEQEGLWLMGGTIGQARFYSRFVALSIKAAVLGKPLRVYREGKARVC